MLIDLTKFNIDKMFSKYKHMCYVHKLCQFYLGDVQCFIDPKGENFFCLYKFNPDRYEVLISCLCEAIGQMLSLSGISEHIVIDRSIVFIDDAIYVQIGVKV
jgi:hypothetical protein